MKGDPEGGMILPSLHPVDPGLLQLLCLSLSRSVFRRVEKEKISGEAILIHYNKSQMIVTVRKKGNVFHFPNSPESYSFLILQKKRPAVVYVAPFQSPSSGTIHPKPYPRTSPPSRLIPPQLQSPAAQIQPPNFGTAPIFTCCTRLWTPANEISDLDSLPSFRAGTGVRPTGSVTPLRLSTVAMAGPWSKKSTSRYVGLRPP